LLSDEAAIMRDRTSIQRKVARGLLLTAAGYSCLMSTALTAATGCGGDDDGGGGKGTLVVPFELGNNRTCEAAGVEYVRAELNDEAFVQEAPCENGQVRFLNVPAGSYSIKISAFDEDDVEVMDNQEDLETTVNVVGGDETSEHKSAVTLTAAPAHLLVRWTFGFTTCRGASIDRFAIKAWLSGGDDLLLSQTLQCALEGDGKDQYREIDDPERRLSGMQPGEVTIQALDKTGVNVGPAAVFKYKAPGPGHDIRVSVECDQGACTGSGKPDPND
jgi:hypothetical protein